METATRLVVAAAAASAVIALAFLAEGPPSRMPRAMSGAAAATSPAAATAPEPLYAWPAAF